MSEATIFSGVLDLFPLLYESLIDVVVRCVCVWWGEQGDEKACYNSMIRSQSFSEPVPLNCELHK